MILHTLSQFKKKNFIIIIEFVFLIKIVSLVLTVNKKKNKLFISILKQPID